MVVKIILVMIDHDDDDQNEDDEGDEDDESWQQPGSHSDRGQGENFIAKKNLKLWLYLRSRYCTPAQPDAENKVHKKKLGLHRNCDTVRA